MMLKGPKDGILSKKFLIFSKKYNALNSLKSKINLTFIFHLVESQKCAVGGWGLMFGTKFQINPFFLTPSLRWLFDDRCYIHLRWSCFAYFPYPSRLDWQCFIFSLSHQGEWHRRLQRGILLSSPAKDPEEITRTLYSPPASPKSPAPASASLLSWWWLLYHGCMGN